MRRYALRDDHKWEAIAKVGLAFESLGSFLDERLSGPSRACWQAN
jgi:hypothetical protein